MQELHYGAFVIMNTNEGFDQDTLINWFYNNRKNVGLNITEFTWPKDRNIPCFDFESKIFLDSKYWVGRGTHRDPKTALTISLHEAIERYICGVNRLKTTNGVATHHMSALSLIYAEAELYERHLVLYSLSQKNGLVEFEISDSLLSAYINKGINFTLYKTANLNGHDSFILLVRLERFNPDLGGLVFTSSSKSDGLFFSAIRNIEAILIDKNVNITNYYNPTKLTELLESICVVKESKKETTAIQINKEVLICDLSFPAFTTRVWSDEMCDINLKNLINPYAEK